MKIGLITFHDAINYGSNLQTYGLYKKVRDLGHECEIIDYQCENIRKREFPKPMKWTLRGIAHELTIERKYRKRYRLTHEFLLKMQMSSKYFRNTIELMPDQYDKYLVGSDIVWGLDITGGDTAYMLDFVKDRTKKYAYAASVGNEWSEKEKLKVSKLLSDFRHIAVREIESAEWVENLTGKKSDVVCDPTMLLTSEEWKTMASEKFKCDNYVVVYFDNKNGDCMKSALIYAKAHGLKVYRLGNGHSGKGYKDVMPYTIEDFLSMILYASNLYTSSYHGILFSVYFNKKFVYFNNLHKSRINTLAEKIKIGCCNGEGRDILNMPEIDYNIINNAVAEYRDYSIQLLKQMLDK